MALETKDLSNIAGKDSIQDFLGMNNGLLEKMSFADLFSSKSVDTVEDITKPGIYRAGKEPNLHDGSNMRYSIILCLRAGSDLYLWAHTHQNTFAIGFKNNGRVFEGWKMLT